MNNFWLVENYYGRTSHKAGQHFALRKHNNLYNSKLSVKPFRFLSSSEDLKSKVISTHTALLQRTDDIRCRFSKGSELDVNSEYVI